MPSTLGLVVGVADVVADRLMLFANRAVLHDAFSSGSKKSSQVERSRVARLPAA